MEKEKEDLILCIILNLQSAVMQTEKALINDPSSVSKIAYFLIASIILTF